MQANPDKFQAIAVWKRTFGKIFVYKSLILKLNVKKC